MKKGLVIALIVGGVFLAACGALFSFSYLNRNVMNRGFNFFDSRDRMGDDDYEYRWSDMPHGMRGDYRNYAASEDFYLQRWSDMLGIPEEELQQRLDDGESLDEIMESFGIEMPCEEFYEENSDDSVTSPSDWNEDWNTPAGMCF